MIKSRNETFCASPSYRLRFCLGLQSHLYSFYFILFLKKDNTYFLVYICLLQFLYCYESFKSSKRFKFKFC
jgi:penicillin-binding protein-related factor A (putative recombinase)